MSIRRHRWQSRAGAFDRLPPYSRAKNQPPTFEVSDLRVRSSEITTPKVFFGNWHRGQIRGAAIRAEVERSLAAFVARADVLFRLTAELDTFIAKACLSTEDAASSPLACQTVADPDANWVVARCCGELATTARSDSCTHRACAEVGF
jgi:hypothetical protein